MRYGRREGRPGALRTKPRNAIVLVSLCASLWGCADDPVRPADTDRDPPSLTVEFPAAGAYDDDGDALVDVRLSWSDSAGAVDLSSIEVRTLRDGWGAALSGANLLEHWRVERADSTGLVLHETYDALLPQGENRLVVSVRDTAGNASVDTILFDLPYASLTKTIDTEMTDAAARVVDAVYCIDDDRVYVTVGGSVLAIDPVELEVVDRSVPPADGVVRHVACFPGDPYLYVTGATIMRYESATLERASDITDAPSAVRPTRASRLDPDLLYVGMEDRFRIIRMRRSLAHALDVVPIFFTIESPRDFVPALAVLPGDRRIYAARGLDGGILVINTGTGGILKRLDLNGPAGEGRGRSDAMAVSPDDRYVYAAVADGAPAGVHRIATDTDSVDAVLALSGGAVDLELSPDGARMWVTTLETGPGSAARNALVDVHQWRVLQEFEKTSTPGSVRHDGGIVFHPILPLFFSGRDLMVDVYLHRN